MKLSKDFYKVLGISILCFLMVFGGIVWDATRDVQAQSLGGFSKVRTYVIGLDPVAERAGHSNTGVTMYGNSTSSTANTGVSVVGIIDLNAYNLVDYEFAIQPGTLWTVNGDGETTTNSSATPFQIFYAFSADNKGITEFELMTTSGMSNVASWLPESAETPYPINISSPEIGRYLIIAIGNTVAGNSQYCVPPYKPDGTISGGSLFVIAR